MKTTQLFFTGLLFLVNILGYSQDNSNAIYGYGAAEHINSSSFIRNTIIGSGAGHINYSGMNNVFLGYSSGYESEYGNNNTYIGTSSGENATGSNNIFIGYLSGMNELGSNKLIIENSNSSIPLIWGDFASDLLKFNGKVGVGYGFGNFPATAGTVNVNSYNLFVNGGILTEEVRVMLKSQWADYVFEKEYNLLKLEEVEEFIKENKHLPNVPSAKEVSENGIELGETAKFQQEKIEELMLYIIEQNKINKQQQEEINELKEQVKLLLENHR